jgi:hypothetical protein
MREIRNAANETASCLSARAIHACTSVGFKFGRWVDSFLMHVRWQGFAPCRRASRFTLNRSIGE